MKSYCSTVLFLSCFSQFILDFNGSNFCYLFSVINYINRSVPVPKCRCFSHMMYFTFHSATNAFCKAHRYALLLEKKLCLLSSHHWTGESFVLFSSGTYFSWVSFPFLSSPLIFILSVLLHCQLTQQFFTSLGFLQPTCTSKFILHSFQSVFMSTPFAPSLSWASQSHPAHSFPVQALRWGESCPFL